MYSSVLHLLTRLTVCLSSGSAQLAVIRVECITCWDGCLSSGGLVLFHSALPAAAKHSFPSVPFFSLAHSCPTFLLHTYTYIRIQTAIGHVKPTTGCLVNAFLKFYISETF